MLTHEEWRKLLDDTLIAPATIVRVLRGEPINGVTRERLQAAAVRHQIKLPRGFFAPEAEGAT